MIFLLKGGNSFLWVYHDCVITSKNKYKNNIESQ